MPPGTGTSSSQHKNYSSISRKPFSKFFSHCLKLLKEGVLVRPYIMRLRIAPMNESLNGAENQRSKNGMESMNLPLEARYLSESFAQKHVTAVFRGVIFQVDSVHNHGIMTLIDFGQTRFLILEWAVGLCHRRRSLVMLRAAKENPWRVKDWKDRVPISKLEKTYFSEQIDLWLFEKRRGRRVFQTSKLNKIITMWVLLEQFWWKENGGKLSRTVMFRQ